MKLSTPMFRLKRNAKLLSRQEKIPLHQALDRVARQEGYGAWSLLRAKTVGVSAVCELHGRLRPGDLLLLGARPGQGKTLMSLQLAVEAMTRGSRAAFFTLEYTAREVLDRLDAIGAERSRLDGLFDYECSDAICADTIIAKLSSAPAGTLVVVDYLQLLDQKRENPELAAQVGALRRFARDRGLILVFVSQIDRTYDPTTRRVPDLRDVRLPNPLDLRLFDQACFLNAGEVRLQAVG